MKYLFITLALISLGLQQSHADEWKVLFNGKDLSGWKANTRPDSFSVENGILTQSSRNQYHSVAFILCR